MIEVSKILSSGWESAIRGMRNPMNSWENSDSRWIMKSAPSYEVGQNDLELMEKLAKLGGPHAKYRRMIHVTCDILAPLYWWKEFDTYKVGTVANSCSTMHKIHAKPFMVDDFSNEHLDQDNYILLKTIVATLNRYRDVFINGGMIEYPDAGRRVFKPGDKHIWWQLIQLLPSSYNQLRTVDFNYETMANIYANRKNHKLDEWIGFCADMKSHLPYSQLFTLEGI